MEAVLEFPQDELKNLKIRIFGFMVELAQQVRARLPDNIHVLRKVRAIEGRQIINDNDLRAVAKIAQHYETLGTEGIDVTAVEMEWRRLRHTTLDIDNSASLLTYWGSIAKMKVGDSLLFPQLTLLASALLCHPISNATVERIFSIMAAIKTKERNQLAVPMVDAVLTLRYSLKRCGETCHNFSILPSMLEAFNSTMYDDVKARELIGPRLNHRQNDDEADDSQTDEARAENDLLEVLEDVQQIFSEQIFFTE